jgi:hypothetical protein
MLPPNDYQRTRKKKGKNKLNGNEKQRIEGRRICLNSRNWN